MLTLCDPQIDPKVLSYTASSQLVQFQLKRMVVATIQWIEFTKIFYRVRIPWIIDHDLSSVLELFSFVKFIALFKLKLLKHTSQWPLNGSNSDDKVEDFKILTD